MAGWCFRRGRDKATARERGFSEQWKKDLKTKRPSQKNQPIYFFEQREQTVHDRREPIIYCLPATIGNASRRIAAPGRTESRGLRSRCRKCDRPTHDEER